MMGTAGKLFSWRKGPWTPEEDKLLSQYLNFHGEGNWSCVSRCSGLNRSGKSCRLRWVNYLRPGLKKGQLTPQEESIIIELHALWGNKWSTIARYLPGRTDNEIKNYWRTHFKKKDISSITTRDQKKQRKRKSQISKPQKYFNIDNNMQQPELAKVLVINKEQDSSAHIDHEDERKERAGTEVEDGIMTNLSLEDHQYYFPEMCNIDQDKNAGWSQLPNNIAADYNNNNNNHHHEEEEEEEEDVLWGSLWNWNLDDRPRGRNFDTTTNQLNKLPTKINSM